MKRFIIKPMSVLVVLVSLAACNKQLNIEPKQSIELGTAFKTEEEINQGLIGCYSIMGSAALYGTDLNLVPELLGSAGIGEWYGTFTGYRQLANLTTTPNNDNARRIWVGAYSAINLANVMRDILTGPNGATVVGDNDARNALIGETEFIRGVLHFELVRLYGKQYDASTKDGLGVPIKLTGATDTATAAQKPTRSTVDQVYTQVINDLKDAVDKLPESNGVRANRYVAMAFLSRVYLQKGDYQNALLTANEVINNGPFTQPSADLTAPWRTKNLKENVFEIQQNDQNNAGTSNDGLATFYADTEDGIGRGDMDVSADFIDEYPAGDKRVDAWYYIGYQYGGIMTNKWIAYGQNIPIIRIEEMYLTRAECNLRLNSTVGALPVDDLAMINNPDRTGQPVILLPTLDDVLKQRRLELAFEGVNFHDILRLKESTGGVEWNDDLLTLPIPQREIDATQGSLVQNPGYF